MRIAPSRRLEILEEPLATCWGYSDSGKFTKLEEAYEKQMLPNLKQVNKGFITLDTDFARLRAQMEPANKDTRDIAGLLKAFPPSKEPNSNS